MSDEKHRTATQFGSATESYSDSEVYHLGVDRETLAPWCRGTTRVLDVATGTGHTVGAIADVGISSVVAADITPGMTATAAREYPVADVVADTERLLLADDILGATVCRIAARHFPDLEALIAEVARALEPGGVFAFEDNVAPEDAALAAFPNGVEVPHDPTHVELHPVSWWREWFAAAGLPVKTVETVAIRLQFDPWTERMNVSPADRDELERQFREAPEEVKELFDVEFDGDSVVSFTNPKALIRARTE